MVRIWKPCLPLNLFQCINVLLKMQCPKVDKVFQVRPDKCTTSCNGIASNGITACNFALVFLAVTSHTGSFSACDSPIHTILGVNLTEYNSTYF